MDSLNLFSGVMLYYRNDLFEELKIVPENINTWDKFITTGKKVRQAQRGLVSMDWSYFGILLRQRGTDLFKKEGSLNLDDPMVLETLEFLVKLATEGIARVPG